MKNPERLHEHDFFAHFSAHQLHKLSEALSTRTFAAGETLFDEGDTSTDLYLLEQGAVRLHKMTAFGEFELQQLGPDSVIGATGFVDGHARWAVADTSLPSELVVFDSATLRQACERDQKFELALFWSLWRCMSNELRTANARLGQFFSGEADQAEVPASYNGTAETSDSVDMAGKLGLFREQKLSTLEINFLASLSQEERFSAGQTIFREGETGEKMYVVVDGRVLISKTIPGVGEEALAFLERGDYFGEMALIDNAPRSADARAHPQGGAVVLALPRAVVEGLLDINKVSSIRLLKLLSRLSAKRVREIHEKLIGWFLLAGGQLECLREAG